VSTSAAVSPAIEQPSPSPEVTELLAVLRGQRRHVLGALDGLSDDQLRRPVLPSGWSCLGLVRHLALDVERWWFRRILGGETLAQVEVEGAPVDAWVVPPEMTSESVLDLYRAEAALADVIIESTPPDAGPRWWPDDLWPDFRITAAREAVLHVITETATHAGHLDAARELIDGQTWMVLTG
jgi:uncharacterized damage-inducible protein DinB